MLESFKVSVSSASASKWFTRDHWRLETPPASYATRDGWSNADVDVVPYEQRQWSAINYLFLWMADGANVNSMQQAGAIMSLGLDWKESAIAIAIGNSLVGICIALNGTIGARHHIPSSIALRASMGFYFSYFAVVCRLVVAMLYFGINTYIGSECMLIMLDSIWPSMRKYKNILPESAGVTSRELIAYFVFWTLQLPFVMIHPRKLRWLFFVKSILAVVAAFSLLGWTVHRAGGGGPAMRTHDKFKGAKRHWAYLNAINIAVSNKTVLALSMPDLTRYARRSTAAYWQALFVPLVYWTFFFMGIVVASAGESIYGQLYWDPAIIIGHWTNRAAAFFIALAFGLATLGTNISINGVATSNDLAFMFPRWINLKRGSFLAAIVGGWATCPWKIQSTAVSLTTFLSGFPIVIGPFVAIMMVDYWILRKTHLHVPMLYQNEGIYRYNYGVNWRAAVTLIVAIPINLPGLIHAINTKVYIGNLIYVYQASWLVAMSVSASVYYILSAIWPATSTYVPQTVESLDDEAYDVPAETSFPDESDLDKEKLGELSVGSTAPVI